MVEAISIGPNTKKGEVKQVEGFLIAAKHGIGKTKKKKGNSLYSFSSEKGERFDVWGNASINGALCEAPEKVNRAYIGKMIRLVFVKMREAGKGKNAQKVCDIFLDTEKDIRGDDAPKKGQKTVDFTIKKA